jgi:hypothetical protein
MNTPNSDVGHFCGRSSGVNDEPVPVTAHSSDSSGPL